MKPRSFAAALGAILFAAISCAPPAPPAPYQVLPPRTPATSTRPVLLYSMAFTAEGEKQYEPNGPYREVLARLTQDFEVRYSDQPLSWKVLGGAKVVLISNPSDKGVGGREPHHVDRADVNLLANYVQGGGGLVFLSNQSGAPHNCEKENANKLLEQFGIRNSEYFIGVKRIVIPADVPIIGGLTWGFYYGSPLMVDESHFAHPRVLVWNDPNLPAQPKKGPDGVRGPLLAVAEVGKGRVVVASDTGWIAEWALLEQEPFGTVRGQDNWEICRRLTRWAAGLAPIGPASQPTTREAAK